MPSLTKRFQACVPLAGLTIAAGMLAAATAASAPHSGGNAGGRDLDQPFPDRTLLAHRDDEAATKNRVARGLLEAEARITRNQADFDVTYYDLDLTLDPVAHLLSGTVAATVEVTGASITTVELNLRTTMAVSAATCAGSPAPYSHGSNLVTVTLNRAYTTGEQVTVSVTYSGNPSSDYFGWDNYGGQHMIWTLSEPFGARYWWPCKDVNSDKPDAVDIAVTVPSNLVVASNGALVSDVTNGGSRTFQWHVGHPIATYLVSLAVHPYTVYSDWYPPQAGGDPMEVRFYVFPDHVSQVQATYALTVPMIDAFAEGFGEYPFLDEKYGHAEFVWGGGMEHQTITSLGGWSEDLISHELSHQWWGDMITCADFGHVWLNEGFATWCEAYWREQVEGFATYQQYMDFAAYYGPGTIFVEDPLTQTIFDGNLSYNKGSWVVHMLRHVVGDTDFFAGLAEYRDLYGYGTATTEQLRDAMESVSGVDLDAFFQQWIYGQYFPVYRYSWTSTGSAVDLTIEQVQTNTGLFTMPIDVRVETTTGTLNFVVQNGLAVQQYSLPVSAQVTGVSLDPDRWILRRIETEVTNPTFANGILLVNGVDWDTYGTEIRSAYTDETFWGNYPITFWDVFAQPAGGYPSSLPAPLGHGAVPAEILGQYSSVIWVGNNFNGDLARWFETPMRSYLEVGGNVLLMSRMGQSFLDGALTDHLDITWAETGDDLGNYVTLYPGLVNIPFIGTQSLNDVFLPSVGPDATLLFQDTQGFPSTRGVGVHAQPPGGGTVRPEGAQLIYMAGRPYRMNHPALRSNVEFLLDHFFGEQGAVSTPATAPVSAHLVLRPVHPNPFGASATLSFELPVAEIVELGIYDVAGRLVHRLIEGPQAAGTHSAIWDGTDAGGNRVAHGIYFVRLTTGDEELARRVVLSR